MSVDWATPGSKVVAGEGGGTSPSDAFIQSVQVAGASGADGSGTITEGGSEQSLFAGAAPVHGFMVQNTSDTDLWVDDVGTAAAGGSSIYLAPLSPPFITPPGYVPAGPVTVFGPVTGKQFMARQW